MKNQLLRNQLSKAIFLYVNPVKRLIVIFLSLYNGICRDIFFIYLQNVSVSTPLSLVGRTPVRPLPWGRCAPAPAHTAGWPSAWRTTRSHPFSQSGRRGLTQSTKGEVLVRGTFRIPPPIGASLTSSCSVRTCPSLRPTCFVP